MKKSALIVMAVMAAVAVSGCQWITNGGREWVAKALIGNGVSAETQIEVGEFNAISVPSFIDVYYTQTPGEQSITLTCDENLVEYFVIEVEEGVLKVRNKPAPIICPKAKTFLAVSSPALNQVKLSGSGNFKITSPIQVDGDFAVKLSGSGDFDAAGAIQCVDFAASTSGSGDAEIKAISAASASFKSSGSGDLESRGITAEEITIVLSGSGDCELECKDAGTIDAKLSGSGDAILSGSARAIVNISDSGSGRFDMNRLTITGK